MSEKKKGVWACTLAYCGYFYVPDNGDPTQGIPVGTRFEDLPEEWVCPTCGVDKSIFAPYEE